MHAYFSERNWTNLVQKCPESDSFMIKLGFNYINAIHVGGIFSRMLDIIGLYGKMQNK